MICHSNLFRREKHGQVLPKRICHRLSQMSHSIVQGKQERSGKLVEALAECFQGFQGWCRFHDHGMCPKEWLGNTSSLGPPLRMPNAMQTWTLLRWFGAAQCCCQATINTTPARLRMVKAWSLMARSRNLNMNDMYNTVSYKHMYDDNINGSCIMSNKCHVGKHLKKPIWIDYGPKWLWT